MEHINYSAGQQKIQKIQKRFKLSIINFLSFNFRNNTAKLREILWNLLELKSTIGFSEKWLSSPFPACLPALPVSLLGFLLLLSWKSIFHQLPSPSRPTDVPSCFVSRVSGRVSEGKTFYNSMIGILPGEPRRAEMRDERVMQCEACSRWRERYEVETGTGDWGVK